jgi:CheY-like chemotaxis protein
MDPHPIAGFRPTSSRPGARAGDLLLVEDDDLVRIALKRVLNSRERPCVAASSVEDAQQLLALHEPAFVVTDHNLAGRRNGIDLLVWMRQSPRLRDVPALLMTGDDPHLIRTRLAAAGLADIDVLAKPFEPEELLSRLARI